MDAEDDPGARLARLRAQLTAARRADRGVLGERRRHVDAACALILALVEELEEDEAERVLADVQPLLDPQTRARLDRELDTIRARERAAASMIEQTAVRGEPVVDDGDPERGAALALARSKAASGDDAVAYARTSLEHAYETVDPEIVAVSLTHLAELLAERGELAEAKRLLEERPPTRDSRAARALYDDIRRRLGEPPPDPPDEPDEPAELAPALRTYFTKPVNLARSIIEGGLPGEPQLRSWSAGVVTTVDDLDSQVIFGPLRSFWCECGMYRGREYRGLTCQRCGVELVHASVRKARVGLLVLKRPTVHPWYAPLLGMLFDVPEDDPEVRARLAATDLSQLAARFKQAIVTAPKAKLADEAGRKLALVDAFGHARALFGTTPASLVLDHVLVPPPALQGVDRAAIRAACARVIDGDPSGLPAVFDALARRV